jgi:hypothetical protein
MLHHLGQKEEEGEPIDEDSLESHFSEDDEDSSSSED